MGRLIGRIGRRVPDATGMPSSSAQAGRDFHLPDGPAAEARNARMTVHAAEHRFMPQAPAWRVDVLAEKPKP
ncbi:hypothetical protein [Streptomyces sp. bgisy034]|uniref:hypothetical protein n=1 Tax=Streptomyces sp. bgisy034 TaxID=3413774 RepID=UPI003EBE06F0